MTPTWESDGGEVKLYQDDCVNVLAQMETNCVDLTVTSPPYDNLRKYNGYVFNFERIAQELYRITRLGGVLVWVVSDSTVNGSETGMSFRQALYFMNLGFNLHDTMIYRRENPPPLNHRRYEQAFEYMFVFSSGPPKTFNPIRKKSIMAGKMRAGTMRNGGRDDLQPKYTLGRYPAESMRDNIFSYVVGNESDNAGGLHPAIFPEKLAADHIVSWSNPGDVVLDPMMGSGTTGKMAVKLGRKFVGIECSQDYFDNIAKRRIEQALAQPALLQV